MAAYQAPPSLGFSRQELWSGLPFPSPVRESEKSKWSHSVVSDSVRPHGLQLTTLLHPWDFPDKSTGVGCHCLLWKKETGKSNCIKLVASCPQQHIKIQNYDYIQSGISSMEKQKFSPFIKKIEKKNKENQKRNRKEICNHIQQLIVLLLPVNMHMILSQ